MGWSLRGTRSLISSVLGVIDTRLFRKAILRRSVHYSDGLEHSQGAVTDQCATRAKQGDLKKPCFSCHHSPPSNHGPRRTPIKPFLIQLKCVDVLEKARLVEPLLRREVDILHPELDRVPGTPLEVVEDAPGQTAHHVDALAHRLQDGAHVVVVVRRAREVGADVPQDLLELLERLAEAEFRHRDPAAGMPRVLDVVQEGGDPVGGLVQPGRARVRGVADVPAVVRGGVGVACVGAGGVECVGGVARAGVDAAVGREVELRGVGVVREDVGCVDHVLLFGRVQRPEEGADVLLQVVGVGAVDEDWVGEPAFVEVPGALDGDGVGAGVGQWDFVAAVGFEGDRLYPHGLAEVVGL